MTISAERRDKYRPIGPVRRPAFAEMPPVPRRAAVRRRSASAGQTPPLPHSEYSGLLIEKFMHTPAGIGCFAAIAVEQQLLQFTLLQNGKLPYWPAHVFGDAR